MSTVHLADLVNDEGELDLQAVASAVEEGPVEVGLLTDEELHWLGPDPDAEPDPDGDAPRLATLSAEAREGALEASLRLLEARGELERDPERPGHLVRTGLHAYAVSLRDNAVARTGLAVHDGDEEPLRALVWRLTDAVHVLQRIDRGGFHRFSIVATEALLGWLIGMLGDLSGASEGEPERAVTPERLTPALDERLSTADHRIDLVHTFLPSDEDTDDAEGHAGGTRTATLVARRGQPTVLRAFSDGEREEQVALDLDVQGLVRWLAAFLAASPAPGDLPLDAAG